MMDKWFRFLGVRPRETKTVWLFFVHHFLLGIGTMLVYVAAHVLLLADNPARNLPLAYCISALAMLAVGRAYAHYQHRLLLRKLATRALLVAVVVAAVLSLLLLRAPSVASAVTIVTGYRLIYLLTNLEFWSMSAVVFNARQGRRLFSKVRAGEMPAKALGAVIAVVVHARSALTMLLFTAAVAYVLALLAQRLTFRVQRVGGHPQARRLVQAPAGHSSFWRTLLGSSPLVRSMGLSIMAVATVAVGVEYLFFMQVKDRFQEQATILEYVGGLLAITYLLAMVFKLGLSQPGTGRLGVRRLLAVLPLLALGGLLVFGTLRAVGAGPAVVMAYFGGLVLVLEVLRRAVLEPLFLVLFQPMATPERLQGYAVVKGFYEPLGLGMGGALLLALHQSPGFNQWVPFLWMAAFLIGAAVLLQRAYAHYINDLKHVLGVRLAPEPLREAAAASQPVARASLFRTNHREAIQAIDYLQKAESDALVQHAEDFLKHADSRVRNRVLSLLGNRADVPLLRRLALEDPDDAVREMASCLACHHPEPAADDLLEHPDLAVRKGAIRGRLELAPAHAGALASLAAIAAAPDSCARLVALSLLDLLDPTSQVAVLTASFHSADRAVVHRAVQATAAAPSTGLLALLMALLREKSTQQAAGTCLAKAGDAALPGLRAALAQEPDGRYLQALAQVCTRLATPAARQVLVEVVQGPRLSARAAALRALSGYATLLADKPVFQRLVEEEMRLAQQLVHGMAAATTELRQALHYELRRSQQRIFGLLMQLYERQPVVDAQRGVAHATGERQASALEILDNLIPRPLYQGLQAMLETGRLSERVHRFDDLLGPMVTTEAIQTTIVRRGTAAFSAWTVAVALRQWHPQPATVACLQPHLESTNALIQESALLVLRQLPVERPAAFDFLQVLHPDITALLMPSSVPTSTVPARERVLMLKGTTLFTETSENVLGTIVPIMREVSFQPEQEIFVKGTLGTSLFIVCEGEVGIFDGARQLTSFHRGEFFGELSLLDAEARSATAVALTPVVAFRIDQEDFYDVIEECAEVARNVMRVLCQRLRRQNERTQPAVSAPA
ncbi:cyclic nucleotide-binding domain-containing protein [Hymenobacter glacialis]|uniref:Cyclic nucleotide-binding domain-containing protein n=1 Tax=Hymenobacter glacialis TaxID=1908236 RepID=A0A1G1T6T7_9BACT|nr:cyclic nucleotide-binding domain-containing protein [Hymenobacter glacialis]OGX86590.1 hypothetical protein BEN48_12485 [Hymenobacter glacialis]